MISRPENVVVMLCWITRLNACILCVFLRFSLLLHVLLADGNVIQLNGLQEPYVGVHLIISLLRWLAGRHMGWYLDPFLPSLQSLDLQRARVAVP